MNSWISLLLLPKRCAFFHILRSLLSRCANVNFIQAYTADTGDSDSLTACLEGIAEGEFRSLHNNQLPGSGYVPADCLGQAFPVDQIGLIYLDGDLDKHVYDFVSTNLITYVV